MFDVAPATADAAPSVSSTVSDPVGDTIFTNAPAFQDIVIGQMTKTASGNFELLMEMAGPVPVNPPLPPPGRSEINWVWNFDLDPTTFPSGYPYFKVAGAQEFSVRVNWNGTEFTGAAIDRRPLLPWDPPVTGGGEAIITPVTFSINGKILEADLPYALIGDVPPSFHWGPGTRDWSGPLGSNGNNAVDGAETVFNP